MERRVKFLHIFLQHCVSEISYHSHNQWIAIIRTLVLFFMIVKAYNVRSLSNKQRSLNCSRLSSTAAYILQHQSSVVWNHNRKAKDKKLIWIWKSSKSHLPAKAPIIAFSGSLKSLLACSTNVSRLLLHNLRNMANAWNSKSVRKVFLIFSQYNFFDHPLHCRCKISYL